MKKVFKIVLINLAVLAVLLIVLEIVLRLGGMETLVELEQKAPGWKNRFQFLCQKISAQKLEVDNSFHTDNEGFFKANPDYFATHEKEGVRINRDGFRGNPFEALKTTRTRILIIGDSFTWGASARPITRSFADLLKEAGYYVYNGGIPGTDPLQYAMIAEKYTPLLKPDIVAVCVYLGNDISVHPALIEPNKNLHFATNFGFLKGYDDRGHFEPTPV